MTLPRAGALALSSIVVATLLMGVSTTASAYQRYNGGCQLCHGGFATSPYAPAGGGANWPSSLHLVHRSASYMNTACDLCHTSGDGRDPYLKSSNGTANTPGKGCLGCHGSLVNGLLTGSGLRKHHAGAGVNVCTTCHTNDAVPPAETVAPPYYSSSDTNARFPCNDDAATSEDWSGDGIGLDNDGDLLYDGNDPDCATNKCGNSVIDSGETCDPPSSCPTTCNDNNACTTDALTGTAATCTALCSFTSITACGNNDGCCPSGCTSLNDNNCNPSCGNSAIETGETCDPPASCPTACNDNNTCTTDSLTGNASACNAACSYQAITTCTNGDGCCAPGCTSTNDNDCSSECGDGNLDPGETCDPPSSCPTTCNDSNACTVDNLTGTAANCNASCSNVAIVACTNGDGCCPSGCNAANDSDCTSSCGNSVLEPGETCDPPSSCPTSCNDGDVCTSDSLIGSAANCNAECSSTPILACADDGCCPPGCGASTDPDCAATCGNGVIEPGETCDPPGSCPVTCDDGDACTHNLLNGSEASCTAECEYPPIVACAGGDGCCPDGCTASTDSDCPGICGNSVVETGETCDPPSSCETSCDDGEACTVDVSSGSAETCDFACSNESISTCTDGDGCCRVGCNAGNDNDCSASCGDGKIDQYETCDPPSSCPTACNDDDACTVDQLTGDSANCNALCKRTPVKACLSGDGCCPWGCTLEDDNDCTPEAGTDAGISDAGNEGGPGSALAPSDDGGCACTVPGNKAGHGLWSALTGLLVGAGALARRRRK